MSLRYKLIMHCCRMRTSADRMLFFIIRLFFWILGTNLGYGKIFLFPCSRIGRCLRALDILFSINRKYWLLIIKQLVVILIVFCKFAIASVFSIRRNCWPEQVGLIDFHELRKMDCFIRLLLWKIHVVFIL